MDTHFKVGDKVKVVCIDPNGENGDSEDSLIRKLINKIGVIYKIYNSSSVPVCVEFSVEDIIEVYGNDNNRMKCFREDELVKYLPRGAQLLLFEL